MRFAAQVATHGACLAVKDGGLTVSFAALDRWARGLTDRLGRPTGYPSGRAVAAIMAADPGGSHVARIGGA